MFDIEHIYIAEGDTHTFSYPEGVRTVRLLTGTVEGLPLNQAVILPIDGVLEVSANAESMVAVMRMKR